MKKISMILAGIFLFAITGCNTAPNLDFIKSLEEKGYSNVKIHSIEISSLPLAQCPSVDKAAYFISFNYSATSPTGDQGNFVSCAGIPIKDINIRLR